MSMRCRLMAPPVAADPTTRRRIDRPFGGFDGFDRPPYSESRNTSNAARSCSESSSKRRRADSASPPWASIACSGVAALPSCSNGRRSRKPHSDGVRTSLGRAASCAIPSPGPASCSAGVMNGESSLARFPDNSNVIERGRNICAPQGSRLARQVVDSAQWRSFGYTQGVLRNGADVYWRRARVKMETLARHR